ncbi:MAG: hypothetical protein JST86_07745 [Bacteroidetes bacterium]|nr:hypothetical protein [Bacteroidota bacterium]
MKILLLVGLICMLSSCFTVKHKNIYYGRHLEKLKSKYGIGKEWGFSGNAADANLLPKKKFSELNKREMNQLLKFNEKIFALIPDSIIKERG